MKTFKWWSVCWSNGNVPRERMARCFILGALLMVHLSVATDAFASPAPDELAEGQRFFSQGRLTEAIAAYRAAARQASFSREARRAIALIYKNLRQYDKASAMYHELLAEQPHARLYANLGEVYYLNNQPEFALRAFAQALDLGDNAHGMVFFWAAAANEQQGDTAAARRYYEQAVAVNPGLVLAHYRLGTDAWNQKDWPRAIRYLETVREIDPSITRIYPLLAQAYYYEKKYDAALTAFRRVAEVFPEEKETASFIERIYAEAGPQFREQLTARHKERVAAAQPRTVQPLVVEGAPQVRVFLFSTPRVRFRSSGVFSLRSVSGSAQYQGSANVLYEITYAKGSLIVRDEQSRQVLSAAHLAIVPRQPDATILVFDVAIGTGQYWASRTDRMYRGSLEIEAERNGCKIINVLSLEEYLYGVVPSEMPQSWPREALKAQAVAARSEAYMKLGRHKQDGYDYCAGVHCQAYGGVNSEAASTSQAVDETRGMIMTYRGRPIDAVYSNSCGGHTQNNIWSDRKDIPYLQGKPCTIAGLNVSFPLSPVALEEWLWDPALPAACNNSALSRSSNFRWMREYTPQYLETLIRKQLPLGRLFAVNILERDPSGHVHTIEVVGSEERFVVEKEFVIRRLLGELRSGMFNINVKLDQAGHAERFIFYGGGWGHAVGMCQVGAATMASQGIAYDDILRYYYTDITLERKY